MPARPPRATWPPGNAGVRPCAEASALALTVTVERVAPGCGAGACCACAAMAWARRIVADANGVSFIEGLLACWSLPTRWRGNLVYANHSHLDYFRHQQE